MDTSAPPLAVQPIRLTEDGFNWLEYSTNVESYLSRHGVWDVVEFPPIPPPAMSDFKSSSAEELAVYKSALEMYQLWHKRRGLALYHFQTTLPPADRAVLYNAGNCPYAGWQALKTKHANLNPILIQAKLTQMRSLRCTALSDLSNHLTRLINLKSEIQLAGKPIPDDDFAGAILGSLPPELAVFKDGYIGAARGANIIITSDNLLGALYEQIAKFNTSETTPTLSSFVAAVPDSVPHTSSQPRYYRSRRRGRQNLLCTNCKGTSHIVADCWAPGGGNEGGGPSNFKSRPQFSSSAHANNNPTPPTFPHSASSTQGAVYNGGSSLFASVTSAGGFLTLPSVEGLPRVTQAANVYYYTKK